ncbi:hypothetical protein SynROS8604_01162 [Synechococcus sp. ROS8604]|nr:hypothetical protein SynROS8604_01162 [Synechococcus sp. ROS8604]
MVGMRVISRCFLLKERSLGNPFAPEPCPVANGGAAFRL